MPASLPPEIPDFAQNGRAGDKARRRADIPARPATKKNKRVVFVPGVTWAPKNEHSSVTPPVQFRASHDFLGEGVVPHSPASPDHVLARRDDEAELAEGAVEPSCTRRSRVGRRSPSRRRRRRLARGSGCRRARERRSRRSRQTNERHRRWTNRAQVRRAAADAISLCSPSAGVLQARVAASSIVSRMRAACGPVEVPV